MISNKKIIEQVHRSIGLVKRETGLPGPFYLHASILYGLNGLFELLVKPGHIKGIIFHSNVHPANLIVSPRADLQNYENVQVSNHYFDNIFKPVKRDDEEDIQLHDFIKKIFRYLDEEKHHNHELREYMNVNLYINRRWENSGFQEEASKNVPVLLLYMVTAIIFTDRVGRNDFVTVVNKLYKRGE